MKLATAFVEVRPDTKAFRADLQRNTEADARSVGKALGAAFAGGAFLAGAKRAIDAASDLNEAANVTKITFGAAEQQVADFAKTAATSIGQSEAAARSATATFGGLLLNLGYTEEAAADTSIQLTKLASDLGSAFNTDPAEAALALSSALRGEQEPILRYNVLLSDTAVRQKAVELGLAATTAAVDDNGKVQARLALIMEQTSRVQGDFANTSTEAANAQRIAAAQAEDAAADLGDNLIPIYERVVAVVGDVAKVFGSLPEPVQTAIIALAGIAALSGPTRAAFEAISTLATIARTRLPQAFDAAATGAYDLAGGLDRVKGRAISTGIEMGLLATAIALTNDQASRADLSKLENALLDLAEGSGIGGEAANVLGKDLGDLARSIELIAAPSLASQIENFSGVLNRALGDTDDDLSNARATVEDLDAALSSLSSRDPEAAAAALQEILGGLSDDAAARLPELLDDYSSSLADVDTQQRTTSGSTQDLGDKLSVTEQAAKDAAESVDLFRTAVDKLLRPLDLQAAQDQRTQAFLDLAEEVEARTEAVIDARRHLAELRAVPAEDRDAAAIADAERDLQDAIDATSLSLDGDTEAAIRNRETLDDLVRKGLDVIETARDQEKSLEDLELIRINERNSLRETLRQLGYNEQAVEEYVAILDAIPLTKETTVTADTAAAEAALQRVSALVLSIVEDLGITVSGALRGFAAGGSVPDGLFTVGEAGPELLSKSGSSVNVIAGSPSAVFDGVGEEQLLTQREMVALLRSIHHALSQSGIEAMRGLQLELT